MGDIRETIKQVLATYAGEALNGYSQLTANDSDNFWTVIAVASVRGVPVVETGLVVRLEGEQVIIEKDVNDKPLVDALQAAGVARSQIVLAYAGESLAAS
jgi:hypothetical protein